MPESETRIARRYSLLKNALNERQRRLLLAVEATLIGRGGAQKVHEETGASLITIRKGIQELEQGYVDAPADEDYRVRRTGGGAKEITETQPGLLDALDRLINPTTRGDPESSLRWTLKSLSVLCQELKEQGFSIGMSRLGELLREMGYSLQSNRKTQEGGSHPDRNAQFEYIHASTQAAMDAGQPVISVDTKKKELVGEFKNPGREWQPKGQPVEVKVHDFVIPELGKANPYGIYDIASNSAMVNVGTDHDTSAFAVESIRRWWNTMGRDRYPEAKRLVITADGGGSNGSRPRLWKKELQVLATALNLEIQVHHFPPGTSKWNKIEHRLFSYISMNWRGRPLISHEVIISLISATTTQNGLKVNAMLDDNIYPTGIKVSDEEMEAINMVRDDFHGEWNYRIKP